MNCDNSPGMLEFWSQALGYFQRKAPSPGPHGFEVLRDSFGRRLNISLDHGAPIQGRLPEDPYPEEPEGEGERRLQLEATPYRTREPGADFTVLQDPERTSCAGSTSVREPR
jgi:hypothetical protein